jgi:hypothetical protein
LSKEQQEQQQPSTNQWKIIFNGCHHSRVMSDKELANPSVELFNEFTLQKENGYFCPDCHDNKPGHCVLSPFQSVMSATKLTPLAFYQKAIYTI